MCDWKKVETEYVTSDKGYRELAKKYKVPLSTLSHEAAAERWVEKRKDYRDSVAKKTVQKTAEKISEEQSELIASLNRSALKFAQIVHEHLMDGKRIKPIDLMRLAQVWQILHDSIKDDKEVDEQQVGGIVMMVARTEEDDA